MKAHEHTAAGSIAGGVRRHLIEVHEIPRHTLDFMRAQELWRLHSIDHSREEPTKFRKAIRSVEGRITTVAEIEVVRAENGTFVVQVEGERIEGRVGDFINMNLDIDINLEND